MPVFAVIKVLYVEDNDDNVYMLKMRLELLDEFEVMVAEDGEKGCSAAVAERLDLILIDLDLPVVDDWEATRSSLVPTGLSVTLALQDRV